MSSSESKPKQLVILHATDIHYAVERVQQLREWLKEKNYKIDVVMVSGDIANMVVDPDAPEEEVRKHHGNLDEIVAGFFPISSNVYYIPGNHDAISTFKTEGVTSTTMPCNVHMRTITNIAPNLHLMGLGGCIPGYQHGQEVWQGFPYPTNEEMGEDLHKLLDPISGATEKGSVILMTHVGPRESSTTVARDHPLDPIISGSTTLFELFCKDELQKKVIMNIHGHTHVAAGQAMIGKIAVINPGPLLDGYFGIYTLEWRTSSSQRWEISSVSLHKLPD